MLLKRFSALFAAALLLLPAGARAEDYPHFTKALDSYKHQIYLGAVSEARKQLEKTPNHAPSLLLIARTYLDLKKCPEAATASATAYNIMGQHAVSSNASRAELEKIFTRLDAQCGASLELGRAYIQSKDYEKAAAYYGGYLEKTPGDLEARLEFARVLSWSKDYPAAIRQFKRYLSARPKDMEARLGLGDAYAWSGEHNAAASQLQKVLSRDPRNVDALVKLGRVYEWQGKYKSAKATYAKAFKISPNNESAAEGLERVKDLASARRRTTPAGEILKEIETTGDASLYLKLGDTLYHNEGKVDEALDAYRRYLRISPADDQARLKLARVLGWEKKYDEATLLFRGYLKKHPRDHAVHLELAKVLAWQGLHAPALTELDAIKREAPASAEAYLAAGDILRWRRDFPEARENYRQALTLDPDNAKAWDGLHEIERQWNADPMVLFDGEAVSVNDIDFKRLTADLRAEFYLDDGRIDLTPGFKNHHFKQGGRVTEARQLTLEGEAPIQDKWRWWGGASMLKFPGRRTRFYGSLGVEGSVSTHTWLRMGYVGQEAVFESNNLKALLSGETLRLDSYNFEFARSFRGGNEVRGVVSAGFLTDTNSRARVLIRALHRLSEAPVIKVGAAYKALSFARTSPLYWSPSSHSGPGLTAELERRWEALSYKVGLQIFRIAQTRVTETSLEGGIAYRPRGGYFGEVSFGYGRGAGASSAGTTNSEYKNILLKAGYRF